MCNDNTTLTPPHTTHLHQISIRCERELASERPHDLQLRLLVARHAEIHTPIQTNSHTPRTRSTSHSHNNSLTHTTRTVPVAAAPIRASRVCSSRRSRIHHHHHYHCCCWCCLLYCRELCVVFSSHSLLWVL